MTTKILEPYLILDFTDERGEIGPMMLGDLGADVIRVETPAGSDARRCPPFVDTDREDLRSLQFLLQLKTLECWALLQFFTKCRVQ